MGRLADSVAPGPLAGHAPAGGEPMVMTVLEAHVPASRLADVARVFEEGTRELPREIVETYLVRDTAEPSLFRLTTVWRTREDLERMRASGVKPKGVQMFEAVGAAPALKILDVVLHRAH
jgi:hypothetical protein